MKKYRANKYDMLKFNCNHFSDEFLRRLSQERMGLPGYLNRPAKVGGLLHCMVPRKYLIVVPPGSTEEEIQMATRSGSKKQWDVVDGKGAMKSVP